MKTISACLFFLSFVAMNLSAQESKSSISHNSIDTSINYNSNDTTLTVRIRNVAQEELVIWNIAGIDPLYESHLLLFGKGKDSKTYEIPLKLGGVTSKKFTGESPYVHFKGKEEDIWIYNHSTFKNTKAYRVSYNSYMDISIKKET